jgi:glycine betaine/proline transport system substrate-binding protein
VQLAQPAGDDTSWILTYIYAQLFEELGYETLEALTLDIPVAFVSMAQRDVDVYPAGWFPLHNTYLDSVEGDVEVVGHVVEQGALQGYLVDRASAEELGITSLEDFKRDDVKQAFDRDGDGRADLVACPSGWGCELTITHQMDAFELSDHVNEIKAGYAASMADTIAAYQGGEPIFFYTWTPNWTVHELVPGEDVVWIETPSIELPEEQQELADAAIVSGVEGCVSDPCQLGWPVNDISAVASSAFLDENPAARTLLERASVDINFIYAQNAAMRDGEDTEEDFRRQAAEYIEANREEVDGWIEQAIASAQ